MITLHAFVGVDEDVYEMHLFRHFLDHYLRQGIESIVLDLHSNVGADDRIDLFRSIAGNYPARVRDVVIGPYTAHRNHTHYVNRFMAEYGGDDRWCVLADGDEFVEFPGGARSFLERCSCEGSNAVIGNLVDRISLDPPFPAVVADRPIGIQFPWHYPLTRQVRRGVDRKIVAFRGHFSCVEGKHRLEEEPSGLPERERSVMRWIDRVPHADWRRRLADAYRRREPRGPRVRPSPARVEIHHFAWDAVLARKMERRATMPGLTHPREIQNVLDFVTDPSPLEGRLRRDLLVRLAVDAPGAP